MIFVYGTGRVQKDFEYIFNKLDIHGYISDDPVIKIHNNKPVVHVDNYSHRADDLIIVCDFDKDDKTKRLEEKGMSYRNDYILADDKFGELDYPLEKKAAQRELAVWGTAGAAKYLHDLLPLNISIYIDNDENKAGSELYGKPVFFSAALKPEQFREYYIIVASNAYWEICKQLLEFGLEEETDFVWYKRIVPIVSEMLRQTIYDKAKYDLTCNSFFNTFEVESTGDVACCCTTFVYQKTGNLIYQDFEEIWGSNVHKVLCLSAANKTYTFCNTQMCPLIMGRSNDSRREKEYVYPSIAEKPEVVLISVDSSCNLYCASCREKIKILSSADDLEKVQIMSDKLLANCFSNARFICMAGDGEVFLSKRYRDIWSDERTKHSKRFKLLSNGLLFNKKNWNEFIKGRDDCDIILCVSVDAATKETYEKLRRGGNFETLMKNLEFASELRKNGYIKYFQLNFVAQHDNYTEMPLFVEMGKKLGADKVFFSRILDWGTRTSDEHAKVSIMDENNRLKPEVFKIMEAPIMMDSIVDWGTMAPKTKDTQDLIVENYYEWEIDEYFDKIR